MNNKRTRRILVLVTLAIVLAGSIAVSAVSSPSINWRARVVAAKLMGNLPEIPITDLFRWLAPGSAIYLERLAENPNIHAAVANVLTDSVSIQDGKELFSKSCATCHGEDALGKAGSNLVNSVSNNTDWKFFSVTKWGRKGTSMTAQSLNDRQIWQVHAYLRSLALGATVADLDDASSKRRVFEVSNAILAAPEHPDVWLTYAGNYAGHRHTSLTQISRRTIGDLRLAWTAQLRASDTPLQSSPIVSGGLVFVTESRDGVVAFDARSGERVWEHRRPVPEKLPLCCGSPNRGATIVGDTLYVPTLDAYLVALDAGTGKTRWTAKVADHREGYSMTGAPLAVGDRVVVGVAGGEFGIRGFLAAFDAATGRQLWRFFTVPGPGELGHDTWAGDSWKNGGAPTWTVGAYDAELNLLFWGVGNPGPPYSGDLRPGDNLFSNSVVAVDATSGERRWHFQFTPGDEHDWDSVQQPILAEIAHGGRQRQVVLWANRNGFFYAIDRRTGEFLFATNFVKQTWARGFEVTGRPIVRPESKPTATGSLVWPAVSGATNWWPPSYDAQRQLVFVPFVEAASIYFKGDATFQRGSMYLGSTTQYAANQPASAGLKAIDANTGKTRWEAPLAKGGSEVLRVVGGVLSTAAGIVFAGYRDEFYAFDADSGEKLWRIRLGSRVSGPPISYAIDEQQFVAVTAGNSLFVFSLRNP